MKRLRNAKIIATLGPASSSLEAICTLFENGADVFRLNEKSTPDEILVTPAVYEALNTIYNFDKVDVGFNDDAYKLINKTKNNPSS